MISSKSFILLIMIAGLSGCMSYHSKPLLNTPTIHQLSSADQNELIHRATSLRNPRLPPMKLDFHKPFTAQELAVLAVLFNPDLAALRAKEGVAKEQVFDAGLLPDPQLGFFFDKTLHQTNPLTIPFSNGIGGNLSWDIAGLITRQTKVNIAQSKYQQIHYDVAWQEWLLANQAELLATRVYFLQEQVSLIKKNMSFAKRLLDITHRNMQRHDATLDEYALRQTAYIDVQDQLQTLQRTLSSTQLQLNQVLGLNAEEKLALSRPKSLHLNHFNTAQLFNEAQFNRLDLIALRAGYESQEQTLYQAILGQFPHFNLSLIRGRDTGAVNTIGANLSFDIPLFNRNRGAIAIADATREQLNLEYKARLHQTQADIAALVADLKLIETAELTLTKQLPSIRKAVQIMSQNLQRGNITEVTYQSIQADLLNKELKLILLQQNKAEQTIGLQIALGRIQGKGKTHVH